MFQIILDVAYEDSLEQALKDCTVGFPDVTMQIVSVSGPGGGNPEIRFIMPDAVVDPFLLRFHGGDEEQAKEMREWGCFV